MEIVFWMWILLIYLRFSCAENRREGNEWGISWSSGFLYWMVQTPADKHFMEQVISNLMLSWILDSYVHCPLKVLLYTADCICTFSQFRSTWSWPETYAGFLVLSDMGRGCKFPLSSQMCLLYISPCRPENVMQLADYSSQCIEIWFTDLFLFSLLFN